MSCVFHPDRQHDCFCAQCGVPICSSCSILFDGRYICANCRNSYVAAFEAGAFNVQQQDYSYYYGEQRYPCPWERRNELGFFRAGWLTTKQVLLSPIKFFSALPYWGGYGDPLLFLLLFIGPVQMFATFVNGMLMYLLVSSVSEVNGVFGPQSLIQTVFQTIFAPVGLVIGAFVGGALVHLGLIIAKGDRRKFESTVRVMCYACAPNVLGFIPIIGSFVGQIWTIVCEIIGIARVHDISYGKAAFAVLWIILLGFCCCGIIMALGVVSMSALMGW
ncbi:MAG: hypothetical protein Kow00107_08570 [Planctomycetota bacterium]